MLISDRLAEGEWPERPLARVPGLRGAQRLAASVRKGLGGDHLAPLDLDAACRLARIDVDQARLGARTGRREALLCPDHGGLFRVLVDPEPAGGDGHLATDARRDLRRHRFRFRIAHELGHTFFYWRGRGKPRRHLLDSQAQEEFCDYFASALLVPPDVAEHLPLIPESVWSLHKRYDVSVAVAARALTAVHPAARVGLWYRSPEGSWTNQWTNHPGLAAEEPPAAGYLSLPERAQLVHVSADDADAAVPPSRA
jgi:uncharacterized protein DUF955